MGSTLSLAEALERFGEFHDAVIHRIELRVEHRPWQAVVELDALDVAAVDGAWHRVRFDFTGVAEWRFEQDRFDMLVIFELGTAKLGRLTYVGFDDTGVSPGNPTAEEFRRTLAFVAAERVAPTVWPFC